MIPFDWPADRPYPPAEAAANAWELRNSRLLGGSPGYVDRTRRDYLWWRGY